MSTPQPTMSTTPAALKIASHCDSLEYSYHSGRLVAATSNLTGPTWDGALVVIDEAGSMQKTILIGGGANNVAWMGTPQKELLLCSCDDGSLQIWSASPKGKDQCVKYIVEHDDIATSVSVHASEHDVFLSSSWDMTIKQWKVESTTHTTFKGHTNSVWDVEWNRKDTNLFISASQDRTVKIWDRREQAPTTEFKADVAVFTASWNPHSEHVFAYGDATGSIYIYDTRNPQASVFACRGHTSGVRKVRFSPKADEPYLASAADDTIVFVWDWKAMHSVLSYKHEDFVRGLAWHPTKPKNIASGSWDKTIMFHSF